MEGTSNYAKEVSLGSSATYFDKEHGESGFSGEAASGDDEGSENMLADSPTEEPIAEKKAASLGGNNNAELDGIQITLGEDGFGVAVKKSSFTSYGLCRRLVLVCTRGGKGRANACYQSRPTAKTNCQAIVIAKLWGDGLLHLIEANLEHNHALNPSSARFLRCHRKMSGYVNKDLLKRGGLYEVSSYNEKECVDFIGGRPIKLKDGDVDAIHHFFAQMQSKQPNFFYLMDWDVEGHLRNVFWADSRSRLEYKYFNDVVFVDTTCLRSKYDVPLVLFNGVNHHGQLILLGCGLLSDESTESYLWLLRTWQACMVGCSPNAIITDEIKMIKAAIAEIFPKVRHRISLNNIMESIAHKLRGNTEYETIRKEIKNVVYNSLVDDEFEEGWRILTQRFGLEDNEWLFFLYENRQLWAPAFLKDTFWAGFSIDQHGDNMFFQGSVGPKTSLKYFLSNYLVLVQRKYEMEAQVDFESLSINQRLVSKFHLEEQLSKIYTLNIFKKFQDELKATVHCQVSLLKMDGSTSTFEVKDSDFTEGGSNMGRKSYKVVYDVIESEVQCYCGYFQFHGILCRHALSVFKFQQVHEIPSHYVLNRWRKNCKLLHASNHPLKDVVTNNQMERYDHLSMRCLRLVEISATSDQKYQFVMKLVSEVRKSLLDDKTCRELQQRLSPIARSAENGEDHFTSKMVVFDGKNNSNSLPAKRRGRPPKRRKETDAEAMLSQSSIGDPSMVPSDRSQNGAPHSSSIASHLGSNIRTNGGFDPMEEVNPNHLSFGSHFGLNANHQLHLGTQLHSGNTLQFGRQAVGSQSRMQWIYQQMLQEEHTPFGRKTG
ncbi:protein FAR1-RELATED SEQUENCE 6-like [Ananas comosus]|uniref:Protein FAR1-RELATED SEQUENCE n=1 Tax=Ananas comosus TaxID=4615 RepID=A0A6P5FMJ9_ANACO|nr:protein FAR1-RELATED SEQUENCE 6-like [Ananas comosus]